MGNDRVQRLPQWGVERSALVHDIMKPRIRTILERAIREGMEHGYRAAHKHTDAPEPEHLLGAIDDAIWLEIDTVFDFEDEPA